MLAFPPMSKRDIDEKANILLKELQPHVITGEDALDIYRMTDAIEDIFDINVNYTYDLPDEVHGCTSTDDNTVYINAGLAEGYDDRYLNSTTAHEMGHVVLHVPVLRAVKRVKLFSQRKSEAESGGVNLYRKTSIKPYQNPEWQAWHFAGALLMPLSAIRALLSEGMSLSQIARQLQVHEVFLRSRLKKLGVNMK